jgi:hypothetical protein
MTTGIDDAVVAALRTEVKEALDIAANEIKTGLWHEEDKDFLEARAKDLVGLHLKARTTTDLLKQRAYKAAAADTLHHVKLMAIIRMEATSARMADLVGRLFVETAVRLLKLVLPILFS